MDFVALDIEQFLSVNELNGREFADNVLRTLGGEISEALDGTRGIACRVEVDRFEIFCDKREESQYPPAYGRHALAGRAGYGPGL